LDSSDRDFGIHVVVDLDDSLAFVQTVEPTNVLLQCSAELSSVVYGRDDISGNQQVSREVSRESSVAFFGLSE